MLPALGSAAITITTMLLRYSVSRALLARFLRSLLLARHIFVVSLALSRSAICFSSSFLLAIALVDPAKAVDADCATHPFNMRVTPLGARALWAPRLEMKLGGGMGG